MNIDDNKIANNIQANFEELAGGDENLDASELKSATEGNVVSSSSALAARALQANPELALALDSADGVDDGVITTEGIQAFVDKNERRQRSEQSSESDTSDISISDSIRASDEIDANGNGSMSIDEIEAASRGEGDFSPATVTIAQSMMDTPTMRALKEMDTDGDGRVSNEELETASHGQGNFSQETVDVAQSTLQSRMRVEKEIDTDGSGSISDEELEAASQGQGDFSQEAIDSAELMLRARADSNVNGEASAEFQAPIAETQANVAESTFDYNSIQGVTENTSPEFIQEVEAIAERLGTRPEYLLAVMSFETGGSFSPSISNPQSSATGLIQFIEGTANGLGTSTAALANMSQIEQLQFVEKYFQGFNSEDLSTLEGVYTAVLAGSPQSDSNAVLFSGGETYRVNRGLDLNNDGQITAGEATAKVAAVIDTDQQIA